MSGDTDICTCESKMEVSIKGDSRNGQTGTVKKTIETSAGTVVALLFEDGAQEMFLLSELKSTRR